MDTLFHGWGPVLRAALAGVAAYAAVVAMVRAAGARSLAKMSAYDLIATVTLGSLLAATVLDRSIAVADGVAAVATVLALQEALSRLQSRSRRVHHLLRERPHVVLWDGRLLEDRMRENNLSADEVRAAVRRTGLVSLAQVQAVVLENDGEWSVMPRADAPDLTALDGLRVPAPGRPGGEAVVGRDPVPRSAYARPGQAPNGSPNEAPSDGAGANPPPPPLPV